MEILPNLSDLNHLLSDLDVVLFDIQDIGSRYYVPFSRFGYLMEVAAHTAPRWLGSTQPHRWGFGRGNIVNPGFESFICLPIGGRHGMTMGEMGISPG